MFFSLIDQNMQKDKYIFVLQTKYQTKFKVFGEGPQHKNK
jgi:hypothetical protein